MSGNEKDTSSSWVDPDDAPEWTDEVFERAAIYHGEKLIRPATGTLTKPGRPRLANPKRQVTLRLDGDLLDRLRETGPGWQSRINDILRNAVKP
ncbi:MAG TPA: BrnA antitoxin family protein [Phenylobacterium sp.]|jgi:uncharacterized protein (DUF4415 family)|nr:BrnA antitoxin family protein [Phenylobacterium sp.]